MKHSTQEFGRADQLDTALGLDAVVGPKLASIIVFAANIEYHLERAIWVLEGIDPKGIRPKTDGKPTSELIAMLESRAEEELDPSVRQMLTTWCEAARPGFIIRHNVAHGVSFKMEKTLIFSRNPRWHGEVRRREFGDLWGETGTLDMIRESFATLLRVIGTLAQDRNPPLEIVRPQVMRALREARSILGEFADEFYNPSFEKY
jgi:hypothetical protein